MKSRRMRVALPALVVAIGAGSFGSGAGAEAPAAGEKATGARLEMRGLSQSYRLIGSPTADHFLVTVSSGGRFVVKSKGRALTPITPPSGCRVDSSFKVSCAKGLVSRLYVRLKRGGDKLIASKRFRLPMKVFAGNGPDRIVGGTKDDEIHGAVGADTIVGSRGDDDIRGAKGRDVIDGGLGNDRIWGGPGHDLIRNSPGNDIIRR